ncbi:hypothetical protein SK128_007830 [Halocaridina rubra]|uniref:AAA+ ATPase domain-containing protein n=1 Tax=Halocaridina rubra TaxID=373956 RepID=A0AAN8WVC2_HALRR
MKCPEESQWLDNNGRSDMQLYQEALSCMELIACQLEQDYDRPFVTHLYDRCNSAIHHLRSSQQNPNISNSLENLLDTLSFQRSLLEPRRDNDNGSSKKRINCEGRNMAFGSGPKASHIGSECDERSVLERQTAVDEMLLPCIPQGGRLDEVAGLHEVKQCLKEALIMPPQYPQLFQGVVKAWTRILLYGPPGTGKTKLAKAIASELKCRFYCVSSASILSYWLGESEKLIRELFTKVRQQPGLSVIFFDEIDSLCRKRSSREDEHSRRVKTELLRQIESTDDDESSKVFILGATNCPWDLDTAFLRRFQRRIYVPLPDRETRLAIISGQFRNSPLQITDSDWMKLLDATEGYSGADLTHLTMAAAFQPIRDLQSSRFWKFTTDNKITPCSSETLGAMQYTLNKLPADRVVARDVEMSDFMKALETTPKTVSPETVQLYKEFSSSSH